MITARIAATVHLSEIARDYAMFEVNRYKRACHAHATTMVFA
jgi:hypothetical protein